MTQVPNLMPALPEIFLAVMAMALLMIGVFHKDSEGDGVAPARLVSYLGVVALAIGLSGLLVGRSDVASPAQLKRATAQTYYVLKLTSGVLRQVKHVTVHEVLEGHMTTAFKRFTTEWSSLYPTTIRRSGT